FCRQKAIPVRKSMRVDSRPRNRKTEDRGRRQDKIGRAEISLSWEIRPSSAPRSRDGISYTARNTGTYPRDGVKRARPGPQRGHTNSARYEESTGGELKNSTSCSRESKTLPFLDRPFGRQPFSPLAPLAR